MRGVGQTWVYYCSVFRTLQLDRGDPRRLSSYGARFARTMAEASQRSVETCKRHVRHWHASQAMETWSGLACSAPTQPTMRSYAFEEGGVCLSKETYLSARQCGQSFLFLKSTSHCHEHCRLLPRGGQIGFDEIWTANKLVKARVFDSWARRATLWGGDRRAM